MKTLFYYFIIFSVLTLNIASSCNKPKEQEETLPNGENTMYYYIDGNLTIPESSSSGGMTIPAINYGICDIDSPTFDIGTTNISFQFYNGISDVGVITLNQSNYDTCQVFDNHGLYHASELWDDGIYHTTWYYTLDGTGEINITYLSEDKKHFKGTFQMTVYHMNTGSEKQITDGHFNINLNTLND